ncbi:SDR family oxidoreductase [Pedobacter sp. SYP-B3415]|uniref:SDR family oxidoreductase n=1 Tax=Pedobacter sp. SYP-B3415 TaxID=2496641 RepID=UPI00101BDC0F|nr:SDR family oxidoreductase [Pedobacter sp. SYP-B3415]
MKILLTGATGYIAQRLLPVLLEGGHEVLCCVRDRNRFDMSRYPDKPVRVLEMNYQDPESLKLIPADIDAAYFLIHSMSSAGDFAKKEKEIAENFRDALNQTNVKQVIYLTGIANAKELSRHLRSRQEVEKILASGTYQLTALRAAIIVGSGSSSFEIIRDLVEKLPVMVAPHWLKTRSQPIAIRNVLDYLIGVLGNEDTYGKDYDIGGPEPLTYKQMLLQFAEVRKLKRFIFTVPVMTPRLSSYWLYFITSTSYQLARNLVDSMKTEVICRPNNLAEKLNIKLIGYKEAIRLAFDKIEQNQVLSSWKDAFSSRILDSGLSRFVEVPKDGVFTDKRKLKIENEDLALRNIWAIGGKTGWYYADWLWAIRGFMDKLFGGVGLRRGRTNNETLSPGNVVDFWRVLLADKKQKRLLLYAEMKLPGEAWLEFCLDKDHVLHQTATFRPLGVWGRLYWYAVWPFHGFIFRNMIRNIANYNAALTKKGRISF